MISIINQLKDRPVSLSKQNNSTIIHFEFSNWTAARGPDFFRSLVREIFFLNLEYNVLKNQIAKEAKNKNKAIVEQLIWALMSAQLLEYINAHYLCVPREVFRLRADQDIYQRWLNQLGYQAIIQTSSKKVKSASSLSKRIRETTSSYNWPRLFFIRVKRVLDVLSTVIKNGKNYKNFVYFLGKITNPLIAYLAWAFYLPRLATNIFLSLKHLIPGCWMDEKEISLGWTSRLGIQFEKRWFELGNDTVWLTVGLINCFIFIGALAPAAAYLTVALYVFDVLLASLRAYREIARIKELQQKIAETSLLNLDEQSFMKEYQECLAEHANYEIYRLSLTIVTASSLLTGMALALPFFAAINPVIPLIGVSFVVAACLISYCLAKWLECYKPEDRLPELSIIEDSTEKRTVSPSILGLFAKKTQEPQREIIHSFSESDLGNLPDIKVC